MRRQASIACDQYDCVNYKSGECDLLNDTNFGERECPFFKTKEQAAIDRANAKHRLDCIGLKGGAKT